jgi:hypothetical protein
MASNIFTPKDIIALRQKYAVGKLFECEYDAPIKKSDNGAVTYHKVECYTMTGQKKKLKLKLTHQVICATVYPPKDEHGQAIKNPKHVTIMFYKLKREDLDNTEYAEEKKDLLIAQNNELCDALDIICDEFDFHSKVIFKKKNIKNKPIFSIRQTTRKANAEDQAADAKLPEGERKIVDGMVALPTPMYRIKINADAATGKLGNKNFKSQSYLPVVCRREERLINSTK